MRSLNLIAIIFLVSLSTLVQAQSAFDESSSFQNPTKIQLFPNPATEYLHVRMEGVKVTNLQFTVHNIIGNEIPVEVEFMGESELRFRIKDFTVGYYLLAMRDEESNFKGTYKFLKR